jgi:hypothetical protein
MVRRVMTPGRGIGVAAALGLLAACASPPPEQTPWLVLENQHLLLYGQAGEEAARPALLELERFRAALEAGVGLRTPREPRVRIVLFASPRAAAGLLDGGWGPGFHAGLADGDVVVASLPKPALQRLYIEAMLAGRSPYWYAQGMADVLSTLHVEGERVTVGLVPRGYARTRPRSEEVDEDGKKKKITGQMLVTDEGWKPDVEKRRPDHWLLAHYLLLASRERAEGLREYLRLWRLGIPSPEAFEQAIGSDPDALYQGEVARYAERGFKTRSYTMPGFAPDEDLRARPADPAEIGDLLAALRVAQARREPPPAHKR